MEPRPELHPLLNSLLDLRPESLSISVLPSAYDRDPRYSTTTPQTKKIHPPPLCSPSGLLPESRPVSPRHRSMLLALDRLKPVPRISILIPAHKLSKYCQLRSVLPIPKLPPAISEQHGESPSRSKIQSLRRTGWTLTIAPHVLTHTATFHIESIINPRLLQKPHIQSDPCRPRKHNQRHPKLSMCCSLERWSYPILFNLSRHNQNPGFL